MQCFPVYICLLGTLLDRQLSVPQLGYTRFLDGSVHLISGVAANLIVELQSIAQTDRASFSDSGGLTSSNGVIRLHDAAGRVMAEYPSDEPRPLLNIDSSLGSVAVWLPSKHSLLGWNGAAFTSTLIDDSQFGGQVTFAKLANPTTAEFFVLLADSSVVRFLVGVPSGSSISGNIEPGIHGRVFAQNDWIIWHDHQGLVAQLRNSVGEPIRLIREASTPPDWAVERMSNEWLHISSPSSGMNCALSFSTSRVTVSLIPSLVRKVSK
jgi:hypothetical protein